MQRIKSNINFNDPEEYDKYKKKYGCKDFEDYYRTYLDSGFIFNRYKNFLQFFPKKNFIFINFDQLISDTQNTLNQITNFLEIDNLLEYKSPHTNNESRAILLNSLTTFLTENFPFKNKIPLSFKRFYIFLISKISNYFFSNPIDRLIYENNNLIRLLNRYLEKDHMEVKKLTNIDIKKLKN